MRIRCCAWFEDPDHGPRWRCLARSAWAGVKFAVFPWAFALGAWRAALASRRKERSAYEWCVGYDAVLREIAGMDHHHAPGTGDLPGCGPCLAERALRSAAGARSPPLGWTRWQRWSG